MPNNGVGNFHYKSLVMQVKYTMHMVVTQITLPILQ